MPVKLLELLNPEWRLYWGAGHRGLRDKPRTLDAAVLSDHLRTSACTGGLPGGHIGISGLQVAGLQSQMCITDFIILLSILGKEDSVEELLQSVLESAPPMCSARYSEHRLVPRTLDTRVVPPAPATA